MKSDDIRLGWRVEDEEIGSAGEPVTVKRELLKGGHMHVRGRTRSGKTSLSIAPLALQLLKPYTLRDDRGRVVQENVKDAVFVSTRGEIHLKLDPYHMAHRPRGFGKLLKIVRTDAATREKTVVLTLKYVRGQWHELVPNTCHRDPWCSFEKWFADLGTLGVIPWVLCLLLCVVIMPIYAAFRIAYLPLQLLDCVITRSMTQ